MKTRLMGAVALGLLPPLLSPCAFAQNYPGTEETTGQTLFSSLPRPSSDAAGSQLAETLVEASKLDKDVFTLTQAATIIEQEQIERGSYTDLTEVLRSVPGLEFKQVGGPGQYNYIKMRGFGSANVLVVVDGVSMNLPSTGDVANLLSQYDPSSISRIEILRGPQTVLYGSNATAGVISITTKRGTLEPKRSISVEAGSLGWKKAKASLQQAFDVADGKLNTSLYLSHTDSDGLLKYEGTRDTTLQASADYRGKSIDAGIALTHNKNRFNYAQLKEVTTGPNGTPAYWGMQLPDPNSYNDRRTETASAYLEQRLTEQLSHRLELGWTQTQRTNADPNDGLLGYVIAPWDNFSLDYKNYFKQGEQVPFYDSGFAGTANYKDQSKQLNYSLKYAGQGFKVLGGGEIYDASASQWGAYGSLQGKNKRKSLYANGEYQIGTAGPVLAAGVRHDKYDVWGSKTTGSVGINQRVGNATIYSNYATSYAAPTLSQLYNPTYGNTNLKPESGRTVELGIRQVLPGLGANWEASLWKGKVKDAILYDGSIANARTGSGYGLYANGDALETQGLELSGDLRINAQWKLKANYTYTDSQTKKKGKDFARTVQVARHKGNIGLAYTDGPLNMDFSAFLTGKRYDWTGVDWIPGYVRFDVSARYAVSKQLNLFARIENLFDHKVQEGLGYKPMGIYGIVGAEYKF
jgi:outer membrane cobalamin receptor